MSSTSPSDAPASTSTTSSVSPTTMSESNTTTTTTSSTISSASLSSTKTTTSSRSTVSTLTVQSTTTSATTTQSSTWTSPSLTTSPSTTVLSSLSVSSIPLASVTVTFSASLSTESSFQASSVRTDPPPTTVLEGTTIFVTSTNSQGQVVTSEPPVFTEIITTTGNGGIASTITQAVINPTLAPNNGTIDGSSFFTNTGAVVGVFVVVGLASASIVMWVLFAIRRRLRMRAIEEDNAVEAAVAAAGLNRAPLDDDDDDDALMSPNTHHHLSELDQRSSLIGLGGSTSLQAFDDPTRDSANSRPESRVEFRTSSHPKGYIPARTTSPSPRLEQSADDFGSSRDRKSSYGHTYTPTYSAGSFEPLLANYAQNMSDQDTGAVTAESLPRRSSRRLGPSLSRNGYSSDVSPEGGSRASFKRQNSSDISAPLNEDDTRCALTVRNIPDNQSQHSS